MKIGIERCGCGNKVCSTYWLTGIGHFVQGSGFTFDEAELIVKAVNRMKPQPPAREGL